MRVRGGSIAAIVIVALAGVSVPVLSRAGDVDDILKELDDMDSELVELEECIDKMSSFFKAKADEFAETEKQREKLQGQYAKLCEHGKTVEIPLLERQLDDLKAKCKEICFGQNELEVLKGNSENLAHLRALVADDCSKA